MRTQHWLKSRIPLWVPDWTLPLWKPVHLDRLRRARMKRNKRTKRRDADRVSFKRFWREHVTHPALRGKPRRWRRAVVIGWWRAELSCRPVRGE